MTQLGVPTTETTGQDEACGDEVLTGLAGRVSPSSAPASAADGYRSRIAGRVRHRTVVVLAALAVLIPLALAGARWPSWWSWIAAEDTPMTWLQSVGLLVTGALAAFAGYVTLLRAASGVAGAGDAERPRRLRLLSGRPVVAWSVLASAFIALALDERFAIHERIRDRVLAPRDIRLPFLPWVGPGDFLILLVAVVGLLALPGLWRLFAADRLARTVLLVGVGLAATAVAMDSVSPDLMTIEVERLEQTLEECFEFAAGLALLAAVATRLQGLLAER